MAIITTIILITKTEIQITPKKLNDKNEDNNKDNNNSTKLW